MQTFNLVGNKDYFIFKINSHLLGSNVHGAMLYGIVPDSEPIVVLIIHKWQTLQLNMADVSICSVS